ncbi:hypothetical protein BY996DRAFT_8394051 [Phakopsora pachyrhizi]|nr:hypothetical protein BY996DRAFT_8394051 [Phakopsora pachyrhizi]
MTTPGDEKVRRPTNKNKKKGDLWLEDYPEVKEAQTDGLDYDLRGWEPVEYEYLKFKSCIVSTLNAAFCVNGFDLAVKKPLGSKSRQKTLTSKP